MTRTAGRPEKITCFRKLFPCPRGENGEMSAPLPADDRPPQAAAFHVPPPGCSTPPGFLTPPEREARPELETRPDFVARPDLEAPPAADAELELEFVPEPVLPEPVRQRITALAAAALPT